MWRPRDLGVVLLRVVREGFLEETSAVQPGGCTG